MSNKGCAAADQHDWQSLARFLKGFHEPLKARAASFIHFCDQAEIDIAHQRSIADVGAPATGVEDRRTYRGSAGMHWTQSRTATIGFEAGYEIFDLEQTGEENIALLSAVWTREFARGSDVQLRLGGFDRDRDVTIPPGEEAPDLDESGVQGQFRVVKTMPSLLLGELLPDPSVVSTQNL